MKFETIYCYVDADDTFCDHLEGQFTTVDLVHDEQTGEIRYYREDYDEDRDDVARLYLEFRSRPGTGVSQWYWSNGNAPVHAALDVLHNEVNRAHAIVCSL